MNEQFDLVDIFKVRPDSRLAKFTDAEKDEIANNYLERLGNSGLQVEFVLSTAGRRINNRIYTPRGQQRGIESWTSPYGKALIKNHDVDNVDASIGRIQEVYWESYDEAAPKYFKSAKEYMVLRDAVAADDPKAIYDILNRNGLLTNGAWKGLGSLIAKVKVNDPEAIRKFIAGTYLTVSAGSHSDRYVCGPCGADWYTGEPCDHRPGERTEDGKLVVMVTGTFFGDELSVINRPANDLSVARSMKMLDSWSSSLTEKDLCIDPTTVYFSDSTYFMGDAMAVKTDVAPVEPVTPQLSDNQVSLIAEAIANKLKLENSIAATPTVVEPIAQDIWAGFQMTDEVAEELAALDDAYDEALGAQRFTGAQRKIMQEDGFCAPGRSLPVQTCEHLKVARTVVANSAAKSDIKEKINAVLSGKATVLNCSVDSVELTELKKDYLVASVLIDTLRAELQELKERVANLGTQLDTSKAPSENGEAKVVPVVVPPKVLDPSGAGVDSATVVKEMSPYVKKVVRQYKDHLKTSKADAAQYIEILKQRKYLESDFEISNYMETD